MRVPSVSITPQLSWRNRVTPPGDDARAIGFSGVYFRFHPQMPLWEYVHPIEALELPGKKKAQKALMQRDPAKTRLGQNRLPLFFFIGHHPETNAFGIHMTTWREGPYKKVFAHVPKGSLVGTVLFTHKAFQPMLERVNANVEMATETVRQFIETSGILTELGQFFENQPKVPKTKPPARTVRSGLLRMARKTTPPATPSGPSSRAIR